MGSSEQDFSIYLYFGGPDHVLFSAGYPVHCRLATLYLLYAKIIPWQLKPSLNIAKCLLKEPEAELSQLRVIRLDPKVVKGGRGALGYKCWQDHQSSHLPTIPQPAASEQINMKRKEVHVGKVKSELRSTEVWRSPLPSKGYLSYRLQHEQNPLQLYNVINLHINQFTVLITLNTL